MMGEMTTRLPAPKLALLCAMLFFSGLASLVFQVVWLRGFAIILGSTIYSMSCVITVFLLGLALGSAIMARWLRRGPVRTHPLLAYGVIELTAGTLSLAVSWALFRKQGVLLPLTAGASAPFALRMASQFALCLALIGVPTTLMGMTLPWVSLLVGARRRGRERGGELRPHLPVRLHRRGGGCGGGGRGRLHRSPGVPGEGRGDASRRRIAALDGSA
jgi:spermidine synthase